MHERLSNIKLQNNFCAILVSLFLQSLNFKFLLRTSSTEQVKQDHHAVFLQQAKFSDKVRPV